MRQGKLHAILDWCWEVATLTSLQLGMSKHGAYGYHLLVALIEKMRETGRSLGGLDLIFGQSLGHFDVDSNVQA